MVPIPGILFVKIPGIGIGTIPILKLIPIPILDKDSYRYRYWNPYRYRYWYQYRSHTNTNTDTWYRWNTSQDTQLCAGTETSLYSHGRGVATPVPSRGKDPQHRPVKLSLLPPNIFTLPDDQLCVSNTDHVSLSGHDDNVPVPGKVEKGYLGLVM